MAIITDKLYLSPSYRAVDPPDKPPDLLDIIIPKAAPLHTRTIDAIFPNQPMVNATNKNDTNFLMLVNDFSDYFYGNNSSPLGVRNATVNDFFNYTTCSINGTVICADMDDSDRNYWALVLLVFPVMTLFGNVLVILSVVRERALQTVTNYFIVSLAVADLMVAVIVMPFGVYYLWHGSWGLPAVVCDVYIAMDVTSSTSSIFNLVAISVDRYIAVTQPIKYAKHKNNTRVWLTIVMVWAISAAIGAPIVLGLNDTPDRNYQECLFNSQNYVIYSSLGSFYIPCFMMMFLYYSIFRALNNRMKKQRLAKRPPLPSNAGASTAVVIENVATTRRFAETSLHDDRPTGSGSNEEERDDSFDRNSVDLEAGIEDCHIIANERSSEFILATVEEETIRPRRSLRSPVAGDTNGYTDSGYVPSNVDEIVREASPPGSPGMRDATVLRNICFKESSLRKNGRFGQQSPRVASVTLHHEDETSRVETTPHKERKAVSATSRFTIYKANKASKKKREKSSAKKERKATKTLAIVLGVFLVCWGPFFSCNMADAVHGKFRIGFSPGVTLFMVTTWLGYINSFVNPVIYTIFNPEFRKAFRKSLKCGP